MDLVDKAKSVVASLSQFFLECSTDLQWSTNTHREAIDALPVDSPTLLAIINQAQQLLHDEPTLLELSSPVVVVGDIHGQCCDLVRLICYTAGSSLLSNNQSDLTLPTPTTTTAAATTATDKSPSNDSKRDSLAADTYVGPVLEERVYRFNSCPTSGLSSLQLPQEGKDHVYLFLGDYVDRGSFSCECVLLLLALKVAYPQRIFLLRGNHESRSMTQREYSEGMNCRAECECKLGEDAYNAFARCFDSLPLAAIVKNELGRWLCCHGGVGKKITSIESISSLERFCEPPLRGPMCDLLWADPLQEDVLGTKLSDKDFEEFLEIDYLGNPTRGCSCYYGYAAIAPLLKESDLLGIVRAHQCKEEGISYAYTDNREQLFSFPLVTTVFSASNYCGTYTNKGAVLVMLPSDVQVVKYTSDGSTWVEHAPYCPPELPEDVSVPVKVEVTAVEVTTVEEEKLPDELKKPQAPADEDRPMRLLEIEKSLIYSAFKAPRSVSFSNASPSIPRRIAGRSRGRRMSVNVAMLHRRGNMEHGSPQFLRAMKRDLEHETHPGWDSIRRLVDVGGKFHMFRKLSLDTCKENSDSGKSTITSPTSASLSHVTSTPASPTKDSLKRTISKGLLSRIAAKDTHQIKLVFDSIDTNGDGQLSLQELEHFASQLDLDQGNITKELNQLLREMDEDGNGTVSLEEFTRYLAAVSVLEHQQEERALAEAQQQLGSSIMD